MAAETVRKIMKHGSSGVIAIPMDYRRFHKLDPGKTVRILYDSILIVIPEDLESSLEEKKDLILELLR